RLAAHFYAEVGQARLPTFLCGSPGKPDFRWHLRLSAQLKDVDGRNKSGHDEPLFRSYQELFADQSAEPVALDNELADELMRSAPENSIHATVLQSRANAARLPLRWTLPVVGAGDRIQIAHDRLVAGSERARHLIAQNEQIGDQPRFQAFAIDPMIGGQRGD